MERWRALTPQQRNDLRYIRKSLGRIEGIEGEDNEQKVKDYIYQRMPGMVQNDPGIENLNRLFG